MVGGTFTSQFNPGVYLIRNTDNGKVYVGSAINLKQRWRLHRFRLKHRHHDNAHLQSAWDNHGESAFEFSVVEYCEPDVLIAREQSWINYYDASNRERGYNIAKMAGSMMGYRHDEETRRRMSKLKREHYALHSHPRSGAVISKETRTKISIGNKGKVRPKEAVERTRRAHLGSKRSEETKRRISVALMGNTNGRFTKGHRGKPW